MAAMDALVKQAQETQQELQKAVVERQQLETQFQESKIVKGELTQLESDAKVYKLNAGLVLAAEDKNEAETTVSKRLEFIEGRIKDTDGRIQALQTKLQQTQTEFQAAQANVQGTK